MPLGLRCLREQSAVTPMTQNQKTHSLRIDLLLAGVMVVAGLTISGISLTRIANSDLQVAQATQPLQSTPGAETKPSAPAEPVTTGTRPTPIPPQPAQPPDNFMPQARAVGPRGASGAADDGPLPPAEIPNAGRGPAARGKGLLDKLLGTL